MLYPLLVVLASLVLLVYSADRFVEGSASAAHSFGMPPLLIGMVFVGFGTSAPELMVSALAAYENNAGIALGNAYGSNIANIGLILGIAAIIKPISVNSAVLRKELPILTAITALAAFQLYDSHLSRFDSSLLIGVFIVLIAWSIKEGFTKSNDSFATDVEKNLKPDAMPLKKALFWMTFGLVLLIVSSRFLVWGAVNIAIKLGVSDLVIGLTIVAVGTSLPELASSVIAALKGEHDIALGNVLGSNLFNTLAVVGTAGLIRPMEVAPDIIRRDIPVMAIFTLSIFIIGYGFRGKGRINRYEATALLLGFSTYTAYIAAKAITG